MTLATEISKQLQARLKELPLLPI